MMNCLATAGDRGSFCKVVTSVCDGTLIFQLRTLQNTMASNRRASTNTRCAANTAAKLL